MLTRCPDCGTTFRVTSEQLRVRSGRVRCGACQQIFNALDTLVDEMGPPAEMAPPVLAPDEVAVAEAEFRAALEDDTAMAGLSVMPQATEENELAHAAAAEPCAVVADAAAIEESATEESATSEAGLGLPLRETPRRRAWPWALGAGAALVLLGAQTAMHFRTEIAVLYPAARPALAAACEALGCRLARPRQPELVGIEASDLIPAAGGTLALVATLKNRAPFAQEYPDIELTLTDTADQPLVRRVLAPADYLAPQTPLAAGFGAQAEVAVNLSVDASGIAAAGYRLYLFYR